MEPTPPAPIPADDAETTASSPRPHPDAAAAEAAERVGRDHRLRLHHRTPHEPVSPGGQATLAVQQTSSARADVPPAVVATAISVAGLEGPVYGPLDVTIPGEGLTILSGRGGSGRTALALTIAGRMKPKTGSLTVLGHTDFAEIRQRVAIAGVSAIDELSRSVTLQVILTEHYAWSRPWYSLIRKADQEYLQEILGPVYGRRDLPPLHAYVSQLSSLDRLLIRLALALNPARHSTIEMLVMDDIEQVRESDDRLLMFQLLANLAQRMPVVVNAVNSPPEYLTSSCTLIELFTDAAHIQPTDTGLDRTHLTHAGPARGVIPTPPKSG